MSAPVLLTTVGAQCFSDLVQPVPSTSSVSLAMTPPDSVLLLNIGDHVAPFSGSLLVNGNASGAPFYLHLIVEAPDSGVVQVIESPAAGRDSLAVLKRGGAVVGAVPVTSLLTGEPTAVTRRVRAVVPILTPDTSRSATSPRTRTLVSLGDTLTLKACGFTRTTMLGCNPALPVVWSVSGGAGPVALRDSTKGLVQALSNGTTTFRGTIDTVTTSWSVTVSQVARRVHPVSGTSQTDTVAATLAQPFVVRISDANDSAAQAAGVQVGWKVTSGGGTIVGGTDTANSLTNASGQASITLRLGSAGAQTVTASVANLLGAAASFAATAYVPQPPATPTNASQYKGDCATAIPVGGTTDDLTACFTATVSDSDPGATIRLAVELEPVGTAFTGTATAVGTAVASGTTASVTVSGLLDSTSYHWQYWAIDQTSRISAKSSFGGNAETAPDLTVSRPAIVLSTATVAFAATQGASNPGAQTVIVTSSSGSLRGLAVGTVSYASGSGWLTTATLSTATAPDTLTLQPTVGSLAPGTYTATVKITSSYAKNSPQAVGVTFTVNAPPPAIALNPTSVSFTTPLGGGNPAAKTAAVTNGGGGTLSGLAIGTITYGAGASGWLAASVSPTTAPGTVTLTATLGSLAAGQYTATVPVTSSAAGVANSPQNISVTFTVTAADIVVTHFSASRSTPAGDSVGMKIIIVNQGSAATPRFHNGIYWSSTLPVTSSSSLRVSLATRERRAPS
jgi:hypothetical protein